MSTGSSAVPRTFWPAKNLAGGCRFAFVAAREQHALASRAAAIGLRHRRRPPVEAFDFSAGQRVAIAVFGSARGAAL